MKRKDRGTSILFKAISKNFFKVLWYYPKMVYMSLHPEKYTEEEMYDYCLKLIKVSMDTCKFKVETYGLENIPQTDGLYLCANHQEKFDPLAIWYTFPRRVGVILNDDATHRPFIREVCKLIESKKLTNDSRTVVQLYSEITSELKNGRNFMIFPEGYYSENCPALSEFHPGSFKSAQRAHCTILPVALVDSFNIFDKGYKTTRPIQVHYLKPILPSEYDGMNTSQIAELVKSRIQEELSIYQK